MKNNNTNVTTADKILVCLIFIIIALVSALITSVVMNIIYNNEITESIESSIQVEDSYTEDKEKAQDLVLDSSMLPQHYVLTTVSGSDTITNNVFVNEITLKEDGSYVIKTSSEDKIIFKDGVCIIQQSNDLIEVFTEYSFTLKDDN